MGRIHQIEEHKEYILNRDNTEHHKGAQEEL